MTSQDFWQQAFLAVLKDGGGTATATNYADIAKDEFEKRLNKLNPTAKVPPK